MHGPPTIEWVVTLGRSWNLPEPKRLRWSPDIPVVIMCRDLLTPLEDLIAWVEAEGLERILLVDNDSSYEPLLDYYEQTPHQVIRLGRNAGHRSAWLPEVRALVGDRPFIVTDPDVVPVPEAQGATKFFIELLNRYPLHPKVGFGLRLDDLPEHYGPREDVLRWESQFWQVEHEPGVYVAPIDTTFALNRPHTELVVRPALRTGHPYVARHTPWYQDSANPDPDFAYYRAHADQSIANWGVNPGEVFPKKRSRTSERPAA